MNALRIAAIALVAHEVNRAYCASLGDTSQQPWDEAPDWQRESAIKGVEFHLANPDAGPDHSHVEWLKEKEANGWTYGSVKNAELKEHPCFVPYDELPTEQKAKDFLFRGVVHATNRALLVIDHEAVLNAPPPVLTDVSDVGTVPDTQVTVRVPQVDEDVIFRAGANRPEAAFVVRVHSATCIDLRVIRGDEYTEHVSIERGDLGDASAKGLWNFRPELQAAELS